MAIWFGYRACSLSLDFHSWRCSYPRSFPLCEWTESLSRVAPYSCENDQLTPNSALQSELRKRSSSTHFGSLSTNVERSTRRPDVARGRPQDKRCCGPRSSLGRKSGSL